MPYTYQISLHGGYEWLQQADTFEDAVRLALAHIARTPELAGCRIMRIVEVKTKL